MFVEMCSNDEFLFSGETITSPARIKEKFYKA